MERLTIKRQDGWHVEDWKNGIDHHGPAVDRLAAYEDICYSEDGTEHISIDRLRQLAEADRDGRVLIAEYPIGTPVYKLNHGTKVETRVIDGIRYQRDVPADYITVHLYDFADAEVRAENPEYAQSRYGKLYTQKSEAEASLAGKEQYHD